MVTGAGDETVPFLVSDVPCPNVVPVLEAVLSAPEPCAHPDDDDEAGLAVLPPDGEPEGNQLVL